MDQSLEGTLFIYDNKKNLVSYYNNLISDYNIVLIGGLEFNFLALPYSIDLAKYCKLNHLGFYIPQFRSHPNYGIYTLEDDIEDLEKLLRFIKGKIILIGNSTGCQVIMKYISNKTNIALCFLQGPVSDVEYESSIDEDLKNKLEIAERSNGVLPFKHEGNFITSRRYLDLFKPYGFEDMFSSYLDDTYFLNELNPKNIKCIFVLSKRDKYAVKNIADKLSKVRNSKVYEIENGDHFLRSADSRSYFMDIIDQEIKKLTQLDEKALPKDS